MVSLSSGWTSRRLQAGIPGVVQLQIVSMAWPSWPLWFSGNYLSSHPSQLPEDAPQTMGIILAALRSFSVFLPAGSFLVVHCGFHGARTSLGRLGIPLEVFFPSWVNPERKSPWEGAPSEGEVEVENFNFLLQRLFPRI